MMRILMLCTMTLLATASFGDYSDESIKGTVIWASRLFDNIEAKRNSYERSVAMCGHDTNRYARIMVDMAATNDERIANLAVSRLGFVGGEFVMPFLYSCVSNNILADSAVLSIERKEGCTERSLSVFESYMQNTNISESERYWFGMVLYDRIKKGKVDASLTNRIVTAVLNFASTATSCCCGVDKSIIRSDPSYRTSRRRLANLRSALARELNDYQLQYVTNAINELVAYPEADLPD